jgi:hypothetical protein
VDRYLARCRDGLRAALDGLDASNADAAPGGRWSITAILDHLDLTYSLNAEGYARRLARDTPATPRPVTMRQWVARMLITRVGYFPPGRRSPDSVMPRGRRFAEVVASFEPHLLLLDQRLKEGARVFGTSRPSVPHPLIGPLSVADWRRFHWVHTRHHLKQIQALRRAISGEAGDR